MLADVFENFRNKCIEIYELDPAHFLSAPRLGWQASLKKTEVELEWLTYIGILLTAEKGIRGGICHAVDRYAKAKNKWMKNYNKSIECNSIECNSVESLYLMYYRQSRVVSRILIVSCAMFNSLLFNCSSVTFSRGWNWLLVSIVRL